MLKPRPWWLFFIGSSRWVTLYPNIYYPNYLSNEYEHLEIIKHEQVHLEQQKTGLATWFLKYIFNRKFRLDQEAEAIAAELLSLSNVETRAYLLNSYCIYLSNSSYFWAARSSEEARVAINSKLEISKKSKQSNNFN